MYMLLCIVGAPTVIPLELNKLSLFGTKMVTLFDRWNKRLLLAKVLVGANGFGAVNFWNYKRFLFGNCTVFFFRYLVSSSSVKHVSLFFEPGFENCFRAVWSKPVGEVFHPPTAQRSPYSGHA